MNKFQMKCKKMHVTKRLLTPLNNVHNVSLMIPRTKEQLERYRLSLIIGKTTRWVKMHSKEPQALLFTLVLPVFFPKITFSYE